MISAEHRRPLTALVIVFAAACLIMVQGLRAQVIEVIIGGATPGLVAGTAPDMVLGQSLDPALQPVVPSAAQSVTPSAAEPVAQPAVPGTAVDHGGSEVGSSVGSVPVTTSTVPHQAFGHSSGPVHHIPGQAPAASPAAPGPAAPAPAPAPTPAPETAPAKPGRAPGLGPVLKPVLKPVLRPVLKPVLALVQSARDNRPGSSGGSGHRGRAHRSAPGQVGVSQVTTLVETWDRTPGSGENGRQHGQHPGVGRGYGQHDTQHDPQPDPRPGRSRH